MNKLLLMSVLGLGLGIGAMQAAEVVVRVAPPRAIVERRSERPSPRHVWIAGYHRWDGTPMPGNPVDGMFRHENMRCGLHRDGSIGMTDMFSRKAAGGRIAAHKPT
jgi:hypothetical protein